MRGKQLHERRERVQQPHVRLDALAMLGCSTLTPPRARRACARGAPAPRRRSRAARRQTREQLVDAACQTPLDRARVDGGRVRRTLVVQQRQLGAQRLREQIGPRRSPLTKLEKARPGARQRSPQSTSTSARASSRNSSSGLAERQRRKEHAQVRATNRTVQYKRRHRSIRIAAPLKQPLHTRLASRQLGRTVVVLESMTHRARIFVFYPRQSHRAVRANQHRWRQQNAR
jgi:hypothetical protein